MHNQVFVSEWYVYSHRACEKAWAERGLEEECKESELREMGEERDSGEAEEEQCTLLQINLSCISFYRFNSGLYFSYG